jgi:hypothetical protein
VKTVTKTSALSVRALLAGRGFNEQLAGWTNQGGIDTPEGIIHEGGPMKEGVIAAIRRFLGVAFFVALFLLVSRYDLVDSLLTEKFGLVVQGVLYLLSVPVGLFLRLDTLRLTDPSLTPSQLLLTALGVVLLNFIAIGALSGLVGSRERHE